MIPNFRERPSQQISAIVAAIDGAPIARWGLTGAGLAFMAIAAAWVIHEIIVRGDWPAFTDMELYLHAARLLADGQSPYADSVGALHRYPYPPLFADFLALLRGAFGPRIAGFIWICASGAGLVAAVLVMTRRFGFRTPLHWALLGAGVLALGRTARADLLHGQLNIALLLLLVLGFWCWRNRRLRTASVFWAVMICFKPFLGVIVFFIARRDDWKTALMTFVLSGVLFFASFLPTFPNLIDTVFDWKEVTQHYGSPDYAANPLNQSFYGLALRLFTDNTFSQPWAVAPFMVPIFVAVAAAMAGVAFWINAAPRSAAADDADSGPLNLLSLGGALAALMSIGPVSEGDHLFIVLPGLVGALVLTWRRMRAQSPRRGMWMAAASAWLVIGALLAWPRQLLIEFNDPATWVHLNGAGILLSGACGILLLTAAMLTAIVLRAERRDIRRLAGSARAQLG